jgi:hypothetical protein
MKAKLVEHILAIALVACAFIVLVMSFENRVATERAERVNSVQTYLQIDSVDFGNPLHAALFRETLGVFHPGDDAANDALLAQIQSYRQEQFTDRSMKTGGEDRGLTQARLSTLGSMYGQFIILYVVVLIITYYAARSIAVLRFVRMKQGARSYLAGVLGGSSRTGIVSLLKALVKVAAYAVLFSPAYVIAYSIRSGVNTDSYLFMLLLGVFSNGLLINYANKFYAFLLSEERKGYVQTAIVKNLRASYEWGKEGITRRSALWPGSRFTGHVFSHLYLNARYQFIVTLKEHASFLITGLIIIEMALNVQGHLGYELLQNILYKQYDVVVAIVLAIFLMVKGTEVLVDIRFHRVSRTYENRA